MPDYFLGHHQNTPIHIAQYVKVQKKHIIMSQVKCLEAIRVWGKKRKMYPLMMSIILRHIHAWMRQTPLDMSKRLLAHKSLHQR